MADSTIAKRQAALRERERKAGLIRRTVTIHESRDTQLKEIVAKWMEEDANLPTASRAPRTSGVLIPQTKASAGPAVAAVLFMAMGFDLG